MRAGAIGGASRSGIGPPAEGFTILEGRRELSLLPAAAHRLLAPPEPAVRGDLHAAKSAGVLRGLHSVAEEKRRLLTNHRPTPFDGIGRPGGPRPRDQYASLLGPAHMALAALARYEAAITAAETLTGELVGAFTLLDTALRAADGAGGNDILDATRVEHLLIIRRQLEGARREHAELFGELEDARHLRPSFEAKTARLYEAGISAIYEQIVSDRTAALESLRQRVEMIHASTAEAATPARELAALWEARTGQPVRLPRIKWPKGTDPFAGPELLVEPTE